LKSCMDCARSFLNISNACFISVRDASALLLLLSLKEVSLWSIVSVKCCNFFSNDSSELESSLLARRDWLLVSVLLRKISYRTDSSMRFISVESASSLWSLDFWVNSFMRMMMSRMIVIARSMYVSIIILFQQVSVEWREGKNFLEKRKRWVKNFVLFIHTCCLLSLPWYKESNKEKSRQTRTLRAFCLASATHHTAKNGFRLRER